VAREEQQQQEEEEEEEDALNTSQADILDGVDAIALGPDRLTTEDTW
jgi:hypothetical protein